MYYRKFMPSSHLLPFVECYFAWEKQDVSTQPMSIKPSPTGFASLVFNYGDGCSVDKGKCGSLLVPSAFLTGQSTQSYTLTLSGRIDMVGVVFKPAGLSSLFDLPMYEFSEERISLTDVSGKSLQFLQEQIQQVHTPVDHVRPLDQFLNRQLFKSGNIFNRTDYVANAIVDRKEVVNVSALVDDMFVGRRQVKRQFIQKVGVSPNYYAHTRYFWAQLVSQRWQTTDWHDLIHRCGYYDQSYFIRDFTQLTGKRPTRYVKDNFERHRKICTGNRGFIPMWS